MDSKKWEEKIFHEGISAMEIWALIKDLKFAEENRDRFYKHLETIAYAFRLDWWDGDFPIADVLRRLPRD
jgi:hypothetical protein